MSVLFNHACRYELFDRNPIYLVRQSAKRRRVPVVLLPAEIKALVNRLGLRERTLVLIAASTGLRQSEIFGLKWGDIDFAQRAMGKPAPCKTADHCSIHPRREHEAGRSPRKVSGSDQNRCKKYKSGGINGTSGWPSG
jgi:integrase